MSKKKIKKTPSQPGEKVTSPGFYLIIETREKIKKDS